jgi:TolA-binding protein
MIQEVDNRQSLTRYLLGDVSDNERERIEESFTDENAFNEYLVVEEDLVDAYIRGELSPQERRKFEDNYLGPSLERRERVAIARAILECLPEMQKSPAPVAAVAAAGADSKPSSIKAFFSRYKVAALQYALAAIVVGVLTFWLSSLHSQITKMNTERATAEQRQRQLDDEKRRFRQREQELQQQLDEQRITREQLTEQLQRERTEHDRRVQELMDEIQRANAERAQSFAISIFSFPHSTKGTGSSVAQPIRRGTKWVTVNLILPRELEYKTYRADLESASGTTRQDGLTVKNTGQGKAVVMRPFSPNSLTDGDNTVTLYGLDQDGKYQPVDGYTIRVRKE